MSDIKCGVKKKIIIILVVVDVVVVIIVVVVVLLGGQRQCLLVQFSFVVSNVLSKFPLCLLSLEDLLSNLIASSGSSSIASSSLCRSFALLKHIGFAAFGEPTSA